MHGVFLEPPRLYDPFKALSKELFEKFFAFTSKPIRELKSQLKGEQQYNTNFAYAYSSLREFRLVKLSYQGVDALVCPLMTLLYWRFTGDLYYEGVPEFANEFGDGFQNYVGEVLERACPDPVQRLSEQEYAVGTAKKRSVDWIIASSHWRPTSLRKGPLVALNVSAVTARFPAVRIAENICSL